MRDLFNMDNALFRTLGKVADLMILNIACIIFSIPIFTIGASITAMYYVTLKMAENEEGYIFKGFWKSFKQNFKQATVLWLMVFALGLILFLDFRIISTSEGMFFTVLRVLLFVISFVYLITVLYIFPVLSRFYNTIRGTIKNSLLIAIANFPYTLLMLVITIAPIIITLLNGYTLWYGILVWILVGFSGITFLNSFFMKKVLKKYMPEDEAAEETDPDLWVTEDLPVETDEITADDAQKLPETETVSQAPTEEASADRSLQE